MSGLNRDGVLRALGSSGARKKSRKVAEIST